MPDITSPDVLAVFNSYPNQIRQKLMFVRQLIFDTAAELDPARILEETLKWGEPSYLTKKGSTIRLGWKASSPNQYALFFHCKTKLVDTFKELYGDELNFDGNRAIVLWVVDDVPIEKIKHCISLTLTYHLRKHLPLLGE